MIFAEFVEVFTPFLISPRGEMVYSFMGENFYSFPRGVRLGRG
jgi:hypothetical protein